MQSRTEMSPAFQAQLVAERQALYAYALHVTRNAAEAEDLVSDVLLRAIECWEQFRSESNLGAWLHTIAFHLFVDGTLESWRRRVSLFSDISPDRSFDVVGDADPEARYCDALLADQLRSALDTIPKAYRLATERRDFDDRSYDDIARELNAPLGTVKMRIHRGRRMLRERVAA